MTDYIAEWNELEPVDAGPTPRDGRSTWSTVEAEYGDAVAPSAMRMAPMEGAERDRLLVEHLPTVRYVARRIHERLPQHVELDDLI